MKIAFYKGFCGDWMDKTISITTFSKYSHVELVFDDGVCASSSQRDDGVRFKQIDLTSGSWDIYNLDKINAAGELLIRNYFNRHLGEKYDWAGAIGSAFHLNFSSKDKKFCSEICSVVLGHERVMSPGVLYHTLVKNKEITLIR